MSCPITDVRGRVHRPDVSQRVRPQAGLRRRGGGLLRRPPRPSLRVLGADGPDDQGVRRRHPRFRRRARAGPGHVRQGAQGRRRPGVPGPVHRLRRGAVRRPGAGEDDGVPHPAALQPETGKTYPWLVRPPRWSTISTSTASTTTSGRSSSSSAPTSPTPPSCASTATSGPNARPPRPASPSRRSTTGSSRSRPARLQRICDRLGRREDRRAAAQVAGAACPPLHRARPPAGYRYDISILQAEFSLTQVLDRPLSGRVFFEEVIRENLDIGRPDQVCLDLRPADRTPAGADPGPVPHPGHHRRGHPVAARRLQAHQDQAVPQARAGPCAPRPPSTTPVISASAKRLPNLPALRQIGFSANRRLLDVQPISHDPIRGAEAFTRSRHPVVIDDGTRIPGLRFGDPRVHALLSALVVFRLLPNGFANRDLRAHLAPLLGTRSQRHDRRPDDLRPATTPPPRAHRTHPPHPPLPRHRHSGCNTRCCSPTPTTTCSAPVSPRSATPAHPGRPRLRSRRPRLPGRLRRPHPTSRTRRLKTQTTIRPNANLTQDSRPGRLSKLTGLRPAQRGMPLVALG